MKIGLAQINSSVGAVASNAEKMLAWMQQAAESSVDILVFPELVLSGYSPGDLLLLQRFQNQLETALSGLIAKTGEMVVIIGHPIWDDGHIFNGASVCQNGSIIFQYRKQTLPNYGVFDEKRYFETGEQPGIFEVKGRKYGLLICEDGWTSEASEAFLGQGLAAMIQINASPFDVQKVACRRQVVQERVLQTGLPLAYVNLMGGQDEVIFDGGSFLMEADGQTVHQAAFFEEGIYSATLENGCWLPSFESVSMPGAMSAIYQALVLGLRDFCHKTGIHSLLLGLSGGIDSAVSLVLAVDALGADRVNAVMMPSRYTSPQSIEDAVQQAKLLGVSYQEISIEPIFKAALDTLAAPWQGLKAGLAEENLQARARGMILMGISNKTGSVVLNTTNKSELAVGYGTLYGDLIGAFAILKDVLKTEVYQLARWLNHTEIRIPVRVIERAPSAELRDHQTDQDSLPPYPVLDRIIQGYLAEGLAPEALVAEACSLSLVQAVVAMIHRAEYKRAQAPLGPKISERAFGRDWRYPIAAGQFSG